MKKYIFFLAVMVWACGSDEPEIDDKAPIIHSEGLFPLACTVLERGKTHMFKVQFSDNLELGSYRLDIHHNFDHHNHSTDPEACDEDPPKTPVKPYLLIASHPIPAGVREFTAEVPVVIPADVDTGDYHFTIDVTDKTGWQTSKRLSIKIN